jgi:SAM-dependent methyltransferase
VRLLEILVRGGVLAPPEQGRYEWTGERPRPLSPAALRERFPACEAEVTLLERCGIALSEVLGGEVDPVALLFADGLRDTLRRLYRETPFALSMNRVLVRAVQRALEGIPASRPVRIIEVGAGTGGTTAFVLPALRDRRASYVFTDVSASFLANAAADFADHSGVSYRTFDVERDPVAQGFEPGSFDIAIAANVIHATRDIAAALRHINTLVAPGGAVLLLEGTAREPWVDLTFGLTDGWWRFEDTALRPSYPLLEADAWRGVLERSGFEDVRVVSASERIGRGGSQALIVARSQMERTAVPVHEHKRRWIIAGSDTALGSELYRILPSAVAVPTASNGSVANVDRWAALRESLEAAPADTTTELLYVGATAAREASECAQAALQIMQSMLRARASLPVVVDHRRCGTDRRRAAASRLGADAGLGARPRFCTREPRLLGRPDRRRARR